MARPKLMDKLQPRRIAGGTLSLQIEISYYVLTFYFRSSSLKSLARSVEIPEKSCQL